MARRTYKKAAPRKASGKSGGYSARPRRSSGSTRRASSTRRKSPAANRFGNITIRLVQEAPQQLSPLAQQLLEQRNSVAAPPKKAKF